MPSSVPSDATREKTRLPKANVLRQPAPSVAPGERAIRVDLALIKKSAAAWLDYPTCGLRSHTRRRHSHSSHPHNRKEANIIEGNPIAYPRRWQASVGLALS